VELAKLNDIREEGKDHGEETGELRSLDPHLEGDSEEVNDHNLEAADWLEMDNADHESQPAAESTGPAMGRTGNKDRSNPSFMHKLEMDYTTVQKPSTVADSLSAPPVWQDDEQGMEDKTRVPLFTQFRKDPKGDTEEVAMPDNMRMPMLRIKLELSNTKVPQSWTHQVQVKDEDQRPGTPWMALFGPQLGKDTTTHQLPSVVLEVDINQIKLFKENLVVEYTEVSAQRPGLKSDDTMGRERKTCAILLTPWTGPFPDDDDTMMQASGNSLHQGPPLAGTATATNASVTTQWSHFLKSGVPAWLIGPILLLLSILTVCYCKWEQRVTKTEYISKDG
jgi:hypothetical protein